MSPTLARLTSALPANGPQALTGLIFQDLSDTELRTEYLATTGEGPIADLLCIELERRGVAV